MYLYFQDYSRIIITIIIIITFIIIIINLLTYVTQLSFHSVAVVLTLVQAKQIINVHKQNNTKHSTSNTKENKYKRNSIEGE